MNSHLSSNQPQGVSAQFAQTDESKQEPGASVQRLIDESSALQYAGGDVELMQSVRESFLHEAPKTLSSLEETLFNQDATSAKRAAHTLKSMLRYIGALESSEIAARLENSVTTAFDQPAVQQYSKLKSYVNQIIREIELMETTSGC